MNPLQTKRNPWPIVIISYFVVFITFIVVFIVFAARQRTDLVRQDYYDEEIRFQHHIDRVNRTQLISAQINVTYDSVRQFIAVALPMAEANRRPTGKILLYRPSDARLDQNVQLALDQKGSQLVDTKKLRPGLWKVRVEWSVNGQEFFFDKSIVVTFGSDISHGGEGRDPALRRPRAMRPRNGRFTERSIHNPGTWRVPALNTAGTAQRAIATFDSSLPAKMFIKYPG